MDFVPGLSEEKSGKKYDGKIRWEDCSNIVEVSGIDGLSSSALKNGDTVLVKFGTKSKKLFKGTVELNLSLMKKTWGK